MFIRKVLLEGYIPFSNSGLKHVEFYPTEPGICILGGNGAGKSSLLRAITPFPQLKPLYQKNGKFEMQVEHNGSVYDISSDFSSTGSPNHFVKDGVELNEGGTGETQRDLVEEYLGMKPYIWELISGNVHICEMTKSARKQLFSTHYPSDLSFVLDLHKKICSQIRAYGNQLKLLQTREGSLRAALINPVEARRLADYKKAAEDVIDRIDKVNLLLETEIERLMSHEVMRKEYHPNDLDGVVHELHKIQQAYISELLDIKDAKEFGEHIDTEHLNIDYSRLNNELTHLEREKESITNNLQDIRDELNKFANLKYASNDDKKSSLLQEMNVIDKELSVLEADKSWEETGLIAHDKLLDVIELEKDISDLVSQLHSFAGKLIGQEAITKYKNDIIIAQNTVSTLMREKTELNSELVKAENRLAVLNKNSYPIDCIRTCALRSSLESSVRDVRLRVDNINNRIKAIDEHALASAELISKNEKLLQEVVAAVPLMKTLWDLLSENYLLEIALKGENFITCLNTHSTDIVNRIKLAQEASKKYYRYKNLLDRKEQIEHTVSMMETVEKTQLSTEVINGIIADRERKIDEGIKRLNVTEGMCADIVRRMDRCTYVNNLLRHLQTLIDRAETAINIKRIRTRIGFNKDMIREHTAIKNNLNSKLREIESTLEDQRRINDILLTETLPTIDKVKTEKVKWEAAESGLSPNKGLPCIYLIRFINRLIARTNAFIKEVWNHDMELVYLSEEEDLDFSLSVMMNKSIVVDDISTCSKGEKSMIDLAFMLALCVERGYANTCAIKLDEIDAALTEEHRTRLVGLLDRLLADGVIKQMFLVNHYAIQTGLTHAECVILSSDGIVVPNVSNESAVIY